MTTSSYKKRRNISIIQFSPQFKKAVKDIRFEFGLPSEGFDSNEERYEWYKNHHKQNTNILYKPLPRYYWYFPKEFVDLIESFAFSTESSKVNYYADVPLDKRAMELIRKFSLPLEYVDHIKAYILGEESAVSVGPALQPILIPVEQRNEIYGDCCWHFRRKYSEGLVGSMEENRGCVTSLWNRKNCSQTTS